MSHILKMQDLKDIHVSHMTDSLYIKLFRLNYTQNGIAKIWDLIDVHESVAVIIYNTTKKALIMVKQFRPAVYFNSISKKDRESGTIDVSKYPATSAITLEFCAGIIDKQLSWDEIAREEVLEECGYNISADKLELIMRYRSGAGTSGALQALYYCEVTDDMKVNQGGGVGDELIDVIEMTISEARELLNSKGPHCCPPSTLFGLSWFLMNKAPQLEK